MINDFTKTIYMMSLYPTITKPSRITSHSATIIDDIFTNNMENKIVNRFLVKDISDHLPVFAIYTNHKLMEDSKIRQRRMRNITASSDAGA